jgi:hypothetical protein
MCYATTVLTVTNLRAVIMINLLKKAIQIVNQELAQYQQLRVNTENEYLAMSCGAFNPRFLAKIKRSKADNNRNKDKEKQQ